MNSPDYLAAAAALFNSFTFDRLVPLATLVGMAALFIWVLFAAQKSADFDASQFLRNDKGQLSAARLFAFVCCMTHTWVVFTRTLTDKITVHELALYALTWSGSLVLLHALEVYRGVKAPPAQSGDASQQ